MRMTSPYVGEVRMFGGIFAPSGWAKCEGQLLQISEYDVLYNLLGTTYGGDGLTTFALPNLSGRIPVHATTTRPLGSSGGQDTVALTQTQMPSHTHQILGTAEAAASATPSGATWAAWSGMAYSTAGPDTDLDARSLGVAGLGAPHENRAPYLGVTFIISLYGDYPARP